MSRQRLRPTKRPRTDHTYYDSVPLPQDFDFVYSSEADVRRPGHVNRTERSSQPTAVNSWNSAATWVTPDDPEFALDPDSQWYDEAVEADLGEQRERPAATSTKKKRKVNSYVSVSSSRRLYAMPNSTHSIFIQRRPHVVWKNIHRQTYLDELVRIDGRGDFAHVQQCMDCIARKVASPGVPEYRCLECFLPDLLCAACCVKRHWLQPLHWIQVCNHLLFSFITLR